MGVNVEFIYLVVATKDGVESLLLCFVIAEVIFHRVCDQRSRWE
jgi:hypothetical protein